MKKIYFLMLWAACLCIPEVAAGQIPVVELPRQDHGALRAAALQRQDSGGPVEFAVALQVEVDANDTGIWEQLPDGAQRWRQRMTSPGAYSLNFGFSRFNLPPGAYLTIYSADASQRIGPFYAQEGDHPFFTPMIPSDDVILEIWLPAGVEREQTALRLQSVQHDFLDFHRVLAGTCNLDVACGEADGWPQVEPFREAIRSVALYTVGGISVCTGFLVNTTLDDCTPYFVTGRHCGVTEANAASMVVYWNYENSTCRSLGSPLNGLPGDGGLQVFNSGAVWRADYPMADMTLVELNDLIPAEANAYYAGWNAGEQMPTGRVACVHHAVGEEKRISWTNRQVYRGEWGRFSFQISNGHYLIVPSWDVGTTESGSSGAPLFNDRQQAIGQLRGGAASCENLSYDVFGWFGASWEGGNTRLSRLRNWLNPRDTALLEWGGKAASACAKQLSVAASFVQACLADSTMVSVYVNRLFDDSVRLTLQEAPGFLRASLSRNMLKPGSATQLTINPEPGTMPGLYRLMLWAYDGLDSLSVSIAVRVDETPSAPILPGSLEDRVFLTQRPFLEWEAAPRAAYYRLEVSASPTFNRVVQVWDSLARTSLVLEALVPGSYYWRVAAVNPCGEALSLSGVFHVRLNQLLSLGNAEVSIEPNPASALADIAFSAPVSGAFVELFALNGQQLVQVAIPQESIRYQISLAGFPAGMYILRLRQGVHAVVKRIVLL